MEVSKIDKSNPEKEVVIKIGKKVSGGINQGRVILYAPRYLINLHPKIDLHTPYLIFTLYTFALCTPSKIFFLPLENWFYVFYMIIKK